VAVRKRILVCWIGHNDLRAMAASLTGEKRDELLSQLGGQAPSDGNEVGPIRTLTESERFDAVYLFSNYSAVWTSQFAKWLKAKATPVRVNLDNPTDYHKIFTLVDTELAKLKDAGVLNNAELCIHLSPGSPAMAGIWLLLGKSRYPATFYQTYKGKHWITDIPFDLVDDFAAEVFRDADTHLQHLMLQTPDEIAGFERIVGESRAIRLAVGRAKRAAMRNFSVLVLGESGTGKELFARAIHESSARRSGPFVAINCAAISRELLESELFGHKKGAFTGAVEDRVGAFEKADGGTLFLDEVGECDEAMQAKLLRVLQPPSDCGPCHRVYYRVGDAAERTSDVRVVAATNRDLLDAVNKGQFREDLFYRLAMLTVKLPPLRERKADIPKIAEHLLDRINEQSVEEEPGYNHKRISDSAMRFVKQHRWPGNVRQLYNALIQAAVMADGQILQKVDLESAVAEMPRTPATSDNVMEHPLGDGFDLLEQLNEIHRHYLRRAMDEAGGVKSKAARLLGMNNYQTLDAQLKRLEVHGQWESGK